MVLFTLKYCVEHAAFWSPSFKKEQCEVRFNLAEDGCVSVSEGVAEVLGREQAQWQAVHTEAFRVQQWVREGAHLRPVDIQHARAELLA